MASFLEVTKQINPSSMKKITLIAFFSMLGMLLSIQNSSAQVVVETKPTPPEQYMIPPPKPGMGYVLIPGHWVWSRQNKMYVWVVPGWVPQKEDQVWRPGYWKEVPRGWKWVPGHWERIDKKKWFTR
ncbi:YXWGXW repeat-containing protein [Mangrovibacterium diazotrophicum]|uniref:YXWGXW repeat-containing protein n=2 Tax=Mangrovibacterium diazotrophicum TaxID=1261403 RepID=A0A419W9H3_9BACT|nr:YXWGXW repeat-containing protein [Mangrovibacterium diazotrophicum]